MILYRTLDQIVKCRVEVSRPLKLVGVKSERLGNGGVHHNVCYRHRAGGAEHTELKLITRERQRRGPVSVGGILRKLWQYMYTKTKERLFGCAVGGVVFKRLEYCGQLVAEEYRHNSGGRLVSTETVIVRSAGN